MLTNSNGVAWNASLDPSLSPNPNTTPDSDVVLSGELVVCSFYLFISTWQWKDQALIFVGLNTFVSEEYYPAFCGPLTKDWIIIQNKHTQCHTLAATERPERTRQHWCSTGLHHCCSVDAFRLSQFLPHKVQLSHNNRNHNTIKYKKYNTPGREGTKYYGIFWGSCNLCNTAWHL